MRTREARADAWERMLEWGLREVEKDVRTPIRRPGRGRWLAAALVLLGLGTVAAVVLSREGPREEAPVQEPAPADWRRVESAADIAALAPDTRFVEGVNLDDEDLASLKHLRGLEGLRLKARTFTDGTPPLRLLTDAAIPHLAAFSKLRFLDLDCQTELTGAGLEVLERLPVLQELYLQRFDIADEQLAVLPELPSLRVLDLSLNHGFRYGGMRAVGRCAGLRSLSLRSCSQLNAAMLGELEGLEGLVELDLSNIGRSWRGFLVGQDKPEAVGEWRRKTKRAARDGAGLNDEVLAVLAKLPRLRKLGLAGGKFSIGGMAQLEDLELRELDLSDIPELDTKRIGFLPPTLERLDLSLSQDAESDLTDGDVRTLRQRLPSLASVDVARCGSFTDVAVAELLALHGLRELDVSGCPKVTEISFDLLLQARQIQTVRLDDLPWMDLARAEKLFERGVTVRTEQLDTAYADGIAELTKRYRDVARGR